MACKQTVSCPAFSRNSSVELAPSQQSKAYLAETFSLIAVELFLDSYAPLPRRGTQLLIEKACLLLRLAKTLAHDGAMGTLSVASQYTRLCIID